MKIISLRAENVKRLSAVEIDPKDASMVVISGPNESGKSSVLDAIEMALGGKDHIPTEPIRRGADSAYIVADLGDIIVTRKFTATGTTLVVKNRDGSTRPSPQALLDGLVGRLSFDPMAFASMDEPVQNTTLRALAKINTTTLDLSRKAAFDRRTEINRDVKQRQAALAQMPRHKDVGTVVETFDALTQQLSAADALLAAFNDADRAVTLAANSVQQAQARKARAEQAVSAARRALEAAELEDEDAAMAVSMAEDAHESTVARRQAASAGLPDRAALTQQIVTIEAKNRRVLENQRYAEMAATLAQREAEANDLTATIEQLDAEKAALLANAAFPIEGLGLNDTGVTWQGLPFAQASTAIRTRVSVAIGAALNPKLRVLLVRNGNDLDARNLALLAETATEHGLQIWLEKIHSADGFATVVIEDGAVMAETVGAR